MRKFVLMIAMFLGISFCSGSQVFAGEIDILLDVLVEQGVLTPIKAEIVRDETKKRVAEEVAQGKHPNLPKWIQTMKLKGDLRLRFQNEKKTNDADHDNEGRIRARVGIESKVADNVKVGLGIATAGSNNDARSRNVTFKDQSDTFPVEWDYGYVEWAPRNDLKIVGGKFKRKPYLWLPTDMLWDGDITPEGASLNWIGSVTDDIDFWANTGVWILDENGHSDAADPFMDYFQVGLKTKKGMVDVKLATTLYDFQGIEDIDLGNDKTSQGSNNTVTGSGYRSISPAIEIGFKKPFGGLPFRIDERIAIFGEYVRNLDDTIIKDELSGWSTGFKVGHKKVKKKGNWQLKYIYTKLQNDAFPDIFPDSDRFGGNTGVEAHEVGLKYVLKENIIFGLDYYKSWNMNNVDNKQNLVQADLLFKF